MEVAVGAALLLVALLMVRSAWNLRSVDYGFTTATVMTGDVTLRGPSYDTPEERLAFWAELQEEFSSLDGVIESTVGTQLPMIRCCGSELSVETEGRDFQGVGDLPRHYVNAV